MDQHTFQLEVVSKLATHTTILETIQKHLEKQNGRIDKLEDGHDEHRTIIDRIKWVAGGAAAVASAAVAGFIHYFFE